MRNNKAYENLFGTWEVTTEGDCEGRTVRPLGTHSGYVDEIAFALADKSCYALQFTAVDPKSLDYSKSTATSVEISFNIDSGTWDLKGKARIDAMKELFKDRPVAIGASTSYAGFHISRELPLKNIRKHALSKLTEAEKVALGLK